MIMSNISACLHIIFTKWFFGEVLIISRFLFVPNSSLQRTTSAFAVRSILTTRSPISFIFINRPIGFRMSHIWFIYSYFLRNIFGIIIFAVSHPSRQIVLIFIFIFIIFFFTASFCFSTSFKIPI